MRRVCGRAGKINQESPSGPWVLLALVVYFLFKCSTEWAQCHSERRKLRFARADFVSAWLVAVAAIALYIGQAVSHSQFADTLQDKSFRVSLILSFCIGLPLTAITLRRVGASPPNRWPVAIVVSYEIVALPLISASIIHGTPLRWVVLFVSLTAMTVLIGAVLLFGESFGRFAQKVTRLPYPKRFLKKQIALTSNPSSTGTDITDSPIYFDCGSFLTRSLASCSD